MLVKSHLRGVRVGAGIIFSTMRHFPLTRCYNRDEPTTHSHQGPDQLERPRNPQGGVMKRFMFLSITVMCMAVTLLIGMHIGSKNVEAQASTVTGFSVSGEYVWVMLSNGEVYSRPVEYYGDENWEWKSSLLPQPDLTGSFFNGPVPVSEQTWGGIKGQYEGEN